MGIFLPPAGNDGSGAGQTDPEIRIVNDSVRVGDFLQRLSTGDEELVRAANRLATDLFGSNGEVNGMLGQVRKLFAGASGAQARMLLHRPEELLDTVLEGYRTVTR